MIVELKFSSFENDGVSHEFFALSCAVGKAREALDFASEGLQKILELKADSAATE